VASLVVPIGPCKDATVRWRARELRFGRSARVNIWARPVEFPQNHATSLNMTKSQERQGGTHRVIVAKLMIAHRRSQAPVGSSSQLNLAGLWAA
jgi:hypothetical protein